MFLRRRKAQQIAEYAVVIGLVISATIAMQVYIKRGAQGKIKQAVDYVEADANQIFGETGMYQYEPYYLNSSFEVDRDSRGGGEYQADLSIVRSSNETITRQEDGYQSYDFVPNADGVYTGAEAADPEPEPEP